VSKSGPNIKPPNAKQTVTIKAGGKLLVNFHVAAKTGATKRNVIASCVFPEGTIRFWILDFGFQIYRENFRQFILAKISCVSNKKVLQNAFGRTGVWQIAA
jgi:hypothetical protein